MYTQVCVCVYIVIFVVAVIVVSLLVVEQVYDVMVDKCMMYDTYRCSSLKTHTLTHMCKLFISFQTIYLFSCLDSHSFSFINIYLPVASNVWASCNWGKELSVRRSRRWSKAGLWLQGNAVKSQKKLKTDTVEEGEE